MNNFTDSQRILPHQDQFKQKLRIKKAGIAAKIDWVGKIRPSDREILLEALKIK